MKIDNVKITPKIAQKWLHTVTPSQRRIDPKSVAKIKMAILRGQWKENGATIVFNSSGQLIDGQHRLQAIYESGVSVHSLVVTNVSSSEEVFETIDDGRARNLSDFLKCKSPNNVGSMLRFYWLVINDQFPAQKDKAPITDMMKIGKPHLEAMEQMFTHCNKAARLSTLSGFFAFLMWYHTYVRKLEDGKVASFIDKFGTGIGLTQQDPVLHLRNRILDQRRISSGKNFALTRTARMALIMKGFYAHVDGKRLAKLQWNGMKEEFPELR